jgi:hypothetical protein
LNAALYTAPAGQAFAEELARRLKTLQRQISRLESTGYEGHSLSTLRRLAKGLSRTHAEGNHR